MVQRVTEGIKVSVLTKFEGLFYREQTIHFIYKYTVTIENQSNDLVQLMSRHWNIKDALNGTKLVDGEGVIGKQPLLSSGQKHTYSSSSILLSPFGAMNGYYLMFNFSSKKKFKVAIPSFKLMAKFALN